MADEKRYFSVKDMFEQAVTRAKTDPRYEEYSKICELDYDLLCSTCKYDKLYRCEFDVVGEVTYGSSEGIYGDIFLYGNWSKERDDPFKSRARVYVLKTLKQDKESYLAVGMLVNLICSDSAGCGCNRTALQTVRIQAVLYRCHNCERGKIQRKY